MTTQTSSLGTAIGSIWALLLGFGILMLGDGLQGTLLAVRSDQEGFSATVTGIIMSSFYAGFLVGSIRAPKIMKHVGHVRVFAALAAMASASILVHAVFVNVWVWVVLRLISGFCFAGLYVVAESWLNDRATNENRGKLLSLYMVVTYVGVGIGQLFLNLGDPQGYPLFVLTSILISIAVVPLLLSAGSTPNHIESVSIGVRQLYRLSPLGLVGMFAVGMVTATFFALGPVYSQRLGMDLQQISWFMTAAVIGTVLMQWPIGALSDRYDRRIVLTVVTTLTGAAAFLCVPVAQHSISWLFLAVGLFAGLALPLYSVCIAYTNDNLSPNQMIAASGTLVLVGGLGAVSGPILVASLMDTFGDDSFFWCMGGIHLITGLFGLYRMTQRKTDPHVQKDNVTPTSIHGSRVIFDNPQQDDGKTAEENTADKK